MGKMTAWIAVMVIVGSACSSAGTTAGGGVGGSSADGAKPSIVATTSIWADVVSHVACDGLADVTTMIPAGADPHVAELSLADRARLDDAVALVANGLDLESGLLDAINTVEASGIPVFRVADHVSTLAAPAGDMIEDGHDHGSGELDPHVWFDPTQVSAALPALASFLADQAALDPAALDRCVTAYQAELSATDEAVAAVLAPIPPDRRKLVTNHDALGYFARRYDLQVIGTVIPAASTLAAAGPAQLEELVAVVEAAGVPAIFAETQDSQAVADALAQRAGGVAVVALHTDSLGPPGSGAETYTGLLETDARLIADALA